MRNFILKILVAGIAFTITFVLGVAGWKNEPLSLCTATEYRSHYQLFQGETYVNLTGYLYGGKELGFADKPLSDCEGSAAEIVLENENNIGSETLELIHELNDKTYVSDTRGTDRENKFARAEVQLIGLLSEREQYCYTSRYIIKAVEIKTKGPIEVIDSSTLTNEILESRKK